MGNMTIDQWTLLIGGKAVQLSRELRDACRHHLWETLTVLGQKLIDLYGSGLIKNPGTPLCTPKYLKYTQLCSSLGQGQGTM
jgi:hypothetical protein